MSRPLDTYTAFKMIAAELRTGRTDVTPNSVREVALAEGYDPSGLEPYFPFYIMDARELVEIEKLPRFPAPSPDQRDAALAFMETTYPFLNGWAASCPSGWLGLLEQGCAHLLAILPPVELARMRTDQVKEKLGTLRWYVDRELERASRTCSAVQIASADLCAACGMPGRLKNLGGWYLTLCEPCSKLNPPSLLLRLYNRT